MSKFIDIVFTDAPGPQGGHFVEVENEQGESIRVGNWIRRDDGYWVLRIRSADYRSTEPIVIPMPIEEEDVRLTEIINTAAAIVDEETDGEMSAARAYLRDLCMQFSDKYFIEKQSFPYQVLEQAVRIFKGELSDYWIEPTIKAAEKILND